MVVDPMRAATVGNRDEVAGETYGDRGLTPVGGSAVVVPVVGGMVANSVNVVPVPVVAVVVPLNLCRW